MPKAKTRKIAAKRFKVTGTGKVLRRAQNARHKRANKSKSRKRLYKKSIQVPAVQARWIKGMLQG